MSSTSDARRAVLDAALVLLEERGSGSLRIRDIAAATGKSTMSVYTHFGSKQGLLEALYLHGFSVLEERLEAVSSGGRAQDELVEFALAYRQFALDHEGLYGLMFERAAPDFVPSDASRMAGLTTFDLLQGRIAAWRPDFADAAADAHLAWAMMHGLISIELTHRRWGGPVAAHLQGDAERGYAIAIGSLLDALDSRGTPARR